MTTGNLTSAELRIQEAELSFPNFDNYAAIALGILSAQVAGQRQLPLAIEIRIGEWTVFKAALPGSSPNNDGWIARKARVVELTQHSTMHERVRSEEDGSDWHAAHGVEDATHAIHGGGIPIFNLEGEHVATLLISGLPQVEDHNFGIEMLMRFKTR
jgi:uncharacterized protein (UPF0303 family)